tara:strand:+ start:2794 stop:3081 length:288 start_codon:yes stop_codon:yes gene_type:complete
MIKDITILTDLSNNKYFFGVIMIIVNIGARFIIEELSPKQKEYINTKSFRRIIIFSAFFVATRDILVSITLSIIFVLFISELFNEGEGKENLLKI